MIRVVIACLLILYVTPVLAQGTGQDEILGVWLTGSKKGKVEVYKNGNKIQGKIVWLKEPADPATGKPKTDNKHSDPKQHNRPLMGLINLWGFEYKGGQVWENGYIYDPENGKQYKCIVTLKDKNTLHVRGYIGISMIGRTDVWVRSSL